MLALNVTNEWEGDVGVACYSQMRGRRWLRQLWLRWSYHRNSPTGSADKPLGTLRSWSLSRVLKRKVENITDWSFRLALVLFIIKDCISLSGLKKISWKKNGEVSLRLVWITKFLFNCKVNVMLLNTCQLVKLRIKWHFVTIHGDVISDS